MAHIAERTTRIETSASSVATQKARELRAQGHDIIALTQGQPDFPTPDNVKQAAVRAMERDETAYTPVGGTPALKDAIQEKFRRDNGLDYSHDQIIASNGGKQVIYNAIMATVEPGDEVIVAAPFWVSYPEMTKFAGGVPVIHECTAENGFKMTPEELKARLTPKSRWLMLNSPNNPSGAVYTADEYRALGDVLVEHPQCLLLSDDIYEHILFDGASFASPAAADPRLYDRTLTVNGVSKAYAMTGWRMGYAGGPENLIQTMHKLQNQSTGNPCSITQAAVIEALTGPQDVLAERAASFQERRELMLDRLNNCPGLSCMRPDGAFYVYPSCEKLIGRTTPGGKVIETDRDFVIYLIEEHGVAAVHGEAYGLSPYFRLSFAASTEELDEACRRIQAACQALI
ncbi:MAG: pyridoxal phosphate-dependent aminotransferase [Magnetovibrio sp.]|nr:pyridoxal phosphate-dependent aminotransferase [Magnetovibrio sp.]